MESQAAVSSLEQKLQARLERRRRKYLCLRRLTAPCNRADFISNDYLGLARSHELAARIEQTLNDAASMRPSIQSLNGATGSRLLSGNSAQAEALERKIAEFHQSEAALLFNSGYDANLGALSALLSPGDIVFYDELCHASMHDGIRLGRAKDYPFRHNDPEHLRHQLGRLKTEPVEQVTSKVPSVVWIVVESLYSMEGDKAPLAELVRVAEEFEAHLFVDEAHATGVLGSAGAGLVQELGLSAAVAVRVHTFGKALGCHGAVIVGSNLLRDYLINFARPFIYSTALPPHSLAAIEAAYELLPELNEARRILHERILLFRRLAETYRLSTLLESESPIQALIVPGAETVRRLASEVQTQGFDVRPILCPTVRQGLERLRICLHSYNSESEIRGLVLALKNGLEKLRR